MKMNKYQESVERLKSVQITEDNTLGDLEVWEYIDEDLNPQEFNVVETFDFLQKLIDRHYKYHWHNLIEDKLDLPIEGETVLCWTAKDGYLTMYRKGEWWIKTEDDELYSTTRHTTYVKGWKYIEEF